MRKYFGLASIIITFITLFILPNHNWKIGILGIIVGVALAIRAPKGFLKYVSFVILVLSVLVFFYLIIMGYLMGGLVDINNNRLP